MIHTLDNYQFNNFSYSVHLACATFKCVQLACKNCNTNHRCKSIQNELEKRFQTRNTFRGTWYLSRSQVHNDRAVLIMVGWNKSNFTGNLSIVHAQRILRTELYFFIAYARNGRISTSGLKSYATIVFLDPDFLKDAKISAIRVHLRQI